MNVAYVLTHRHRPEDFPQAFEVMSAGRCGKVIFDW
jgi:threonine dehydrogenase-like Zn-dependent dehydrogenase